VTKDPGPRDWDKELAEIDKLIASGGGNAPPAKAGAAPSPRTPGRTGAAPAGTGDRRAGLFLWLRLLLALALGGAMTQWPYTHGCGLPLYGYLAGVGVVIVASFWTMVGSWRTRSAFAHFLSIALLLWGVSLAAREVLPRVGYAKQAATWACPARAAAAPAAAAQPAAPAPAPVPAGAQPDSAKGTKPRLDSAAARPAGADTAKAPRRTP